MGVVGVQSCCASLLSLSVSVAVYRLRCLLWFVHLAQLYALICATRSPSLCCVMLYELMNH
jgi:hypothetical protein